MNALGRPASVQQFLTPQGRGAMRLVCAQLKQWREDRRLAELWLQKSLAAWHAVEGDPAFAPPHRRRLQQLEEAPAKLNRDGAELPPRRRFALCFAESESSRRRQQL